MEKGIRGKEASKSENQGSKIRVSSVLSLFSECVVYSVSSLSRCDTVLGVPYAAGPRPTDPGLVLIALWCEVRRVRRARRARLLVSAENRKRTGRRRRKRKERGFSEAARRAPVDAGRSCRGAEMPRGSGTGDGKGGDY